MAEQQKAVMPPKESFFERLRRRVLRTGDGEPQPTTPEAPATTANVLADRYTRDYSPGTEDRVSPARRPKQSRSQEVEQAVKQRIQPFGGE